MTPTVQIDGRRFVDIEADVYRFHLTKHGSIRAAARALGLSRSTLADRAQRLGLSHLGQRPRRPRVS